MLKSEDRACALFKLRYLGLAKLAPAQKSPKHSKSIDTGKPRMTKDEALAAISAAFDDAETWSVVGNWVIAIETKPKREIALMGRFVEQNIVGGAMSPLELTDHIRSIGPADWAIRGDGVHQLILN